MVLFLAALPCGLLRRVLEADDAPFRPVMGKRGEADAAAGTAATGAGSSSSGTTTVAHQPPRRRDAGPGLSGSEQGHRQGHGVPQVTLGGGMGHSVAE